MNNIIQKTEDLVKSQNIAFISSIDNEGYPDMKAMLSPRKIEGFHTFYFTTNTSSKRVSQYKENNKAGIYFYDAQKFIGVLLTGIMEVSLSKEDKEMIWREGDSMYYQRGVTDPDYSVLIFHAQKGRYYENFSSHDFKVEKNNAKG